MKETFPSKPNIPEGQYPDAESRRAAFNQYDRDLMRWYARLESHPHIQAVMHIPADEPIFVLRAQDKFVLDVITFWQMSCIKPGSMDLAVSQEKYDRVAKHLQEIADWQRLNPDKVKIPD